MTRHPRHLLIGWAILAFGVALWGLALYLSGDFAGLPR